MKKIQLLIAVLTLMLISQLTYGQGQSQKFKMEGINPETIVIDKTFTEDAEIFPFPKNENKVFGVAVTADIVFNDEGGVVRFLFVDKDYVEHLIYEVYPLLEGTEKLSVTELSEETALLNGLKAYSVKIEITDATIEVKSLTFTKALGQGVYSEKKIKEKKMAQNEEKINKINKNLKDKGMNWIAGPTEVSEMTYSDRKKLYGQSTFPAGFEFYTGGVISTGTREQLKSATATSLYVEEWDWRNRHGRNWITPVTNQGSCGSCWAFAATGATEAMVNVYFNQQLNLNLSEQEVLSCTGYGDCGGGYPHRALDYIKNNGIVDESTFPYNGIYQPCTNKGNTPLEQIKISGRIDFGSSAYPLSEDVLKRMLIELGPLSSGLYDWSHAIVLVGYKVVKEGDIFFYRDLSLKRYWKTIAAGDPLIGKSVWIFKNSWGTSFGDEGYVYVETPVNNIEWTHAIKTPIISVVKKYEVICEDRDGDGYYWWGLGPKPTTCNCPDTPDGNDADPTLGPLDQYGNCIKLSNSPTANFSASKTVIIKGETVTFNDLSTNSPNSWSWSFAGGTPLTSTSQNPAVTYSTAGTYKVVLTATNSSGSSTKTIDGFIQVNEPVLAPVAEFEAVKTAVEIGELVQFNDLSQNEPTQWEWSFPGGTPSVSTEQNPKVTYNAKGEYDVTLSVSKPGTDASKKVKLKYIITFENTPADYCMPAAINSSPDYISSVVIGDFSSGTSTGSGYSLSGSLVSLAPGKSYNVLLTPKVSTNRNFWKIWIDFNGDYDFSDTSENVVTVNNKKGAVKTSFTVPQTATGITRMRIAMRNLAAPGECDDNYKGEVEDYPVLFEMAASSGNETPEITASLVTDSQNITQSAEIIATAVENVAFEISDSFKCYPNPVKQLLNVKLGPTQPDDFYTIYNINGGKIVSGQIISTLTTVNFENYSPGVYLLRIVNGERVYNERIIKK